MRNCPSPFYENCANALKKCRSCRAGRGNRQGPLHYAPRTDESPAFDEHPMAGKDIKRSQRTKQARKWEKQEANRLGKPTKQSGAVSHDGDAKRWVGDREVRIELKDRGRRKSFNLTLDEYEKGRRQGIEAFGIKIKDDTGRSRTVYLVDEDLFKELTNNE